MWLIAYESNSQQIDEKEFEIVFNKTVNAFEKQLTPYLKEFSKIQFEDKNDSYTKSLIDSRYKIYLQKMETLKVESYEFLLKRMIDQKSQITQNHLIEYFDFLYRNNFTGLDFNFFNSVKNSLK